MVERDRIELGCLYGQPMNEMAAELDVRPNTAILWRQRSAVGVLKGLDDAPGRGRKRRYGAEFHKQVLAVHDEPPPRRQAEWDSGSPAARLRVYKDAVWRLLRKEGICLQQRGSWCVSDDPQFAAKAADIVGLNLNPPENALVISVDEKPHIQVLERRQGYVKAASGKTVRGYKSTYRRHGTLSIFAALAVATGAVRTQITNQRRRVEFIESMDGLGSFPL